MNNYQLYLTANILKFNQAIDIQTTVNAVLKPPHIWANLGEWRGTHQENGQNACEFNEFK